MMTGNRAWLRRGLGISLVIGLLGAMNLFAGLERIAFDARTAFAIRWGTPRVAVPVTVVAIDDATLEQVGRWPWSRTQLVELVEQIKALAPTVIGLDIILAEPTPEDSALITAFSGVQVVLPVYSRGNTFVQPLAQLAAGNALGHIEVFVDPDSVVRSVPAERAGYAPFGMVAARLHQAHALASGQDAVTSTTGTASAPASAGRRFWLNLRPRPDAPTQTWVDLVDTVSAADLLAGRTPRHLITDRLVLVGVTAVGALGLDDHVTPLRAWGAIPGVYLHAVLAACELTGRHIVRLNALFTLMLTLLAGMLGGLIAQSKSHRMAQLALVVLIYMLLVQLAHEYLAWWMPIASPLLSIVGLVSWAGIEQWYVKERERRDLRRLFARYVPAEIMPEILRRSNELGLAGVQRDVVVMFADMRGFTALAEQLEPAQVLRLLNMYLEAMAGAVRKHGGMVDKYLGDGLMALFGAPVPHDHAVQAAVECAIEMHGRVKRLVQPPDFPQLPLIGIGIHVGEAILGTVGGKERMEYTVMGDVVNVAARLEELAPAGTILLSGDCVARLNDPSLLSQCKPQGAQSVRGKQRQLQVYRISLHNPGT